MSLTLLGLPEPAVSHAHARDQHAAQAVVVSWPPPKNDSAQVGFLIRLRIRRVVKTITQVPRSPSKTNGRILQGHFCNRYSQPTALHSTLEVTVDRGPLTIVTN